MNKRKKQVRKENLKIVNLKKTIHERKDQEKQIK